MLTCTSMMYNRLITVNDHHTSTCENLTVVNMNKYKCTFYACVYNMYTYYTT